MNDHNTVVISGRLTREAELRYIPAGDAVAEFSVAVNEVYEKNGEKKESTAFINCKAWRATAEKIAKQPKGSSIMVVGKLKVDSWEDKASGQKRSKTYVLAEAATNPFAGAAKGTPKQSAPQLAPVAGEAGSTEEEPPF